MIRTQLKTYDVSFSSCLKCPVKSEEKNNKYDKVSAAMIKKRLLSIQ